MPGTGQAGGRAGRRGGRRGPARPPGEADPADRRGAVRRQHRPAAAGQAPPPRAVRGRPLPELPLPPAGQPGALATLLTELAGLGANVLDVVHARFSPHLRIGEVGVSLQVETRGPGHADAVIGQLRAGGYTLIFS